jgi:hypothetical protein
MISRHEYCQCYIVAYYLTVRWDISVKLKHSFYLALFIQRGKNTRPNLEGQIWPATHESHIAFMQNSFSLTATWKWIKYSNCPGWASTADMQITVVSLLQWQRSKTAGSLHVANISLFVPLEKTNWRNGWIRLCYNGRHASDVWLSLWNWTWSITYVQVHFSHLWISDLKTFRHW